MKDISSVYGLLNRHLVSLCAFDLVARHGNFTGAARSLGVTQSAVSQRIKDLETSLGIALFKRDHRGAEITSDGSRLLASVRPALEMMGTAVADLVERRTKPRVRLSVDFAFATFWLLPRLPRLRDELKDVDVQILASQTPCESAGDDCDLVIYMTPVDDLGPRDVLLLREKVVAVCSPAFLSGHGPLGSAAALLDLPLLSLSGPPAAPWLNWQGWFAALGVGGERTCNQTSFSNYDLVIQAALDGQGVALGWLGLIDDLLAAGRLETATGDIVTSSVGYAITRRYTVRSDPLEHVFAWIAEQFHDAPAQSPTTAIA